MLNVPSHDNADNDYDNEEMARYAAIDIGSNSVRMAVGEFSVKDGMKILAAERQVTRLGASVFSAG